MPVWCTFRDAARAQHLAEEQAAVVLSEQEPTFHNAPLTVFGTHDEATVAQMRNCMAVGRVDGEASRAALYSTVHGAGRLFGRKRAKQEFIRAQMDSWLREREVLLAGGDLDESPMAYRRLPDVLAHHGSTIRVLHTLRPFAVAMAGDTEFDPFKR